MPSFHRDGDLFSASLQTGPSHVWLGLRFSAEPVNCVKMNKRPPIGTCSHGALDEKQIRKAVLGVIDDESVLFYASEIEYVSNDSPRYGMYAHCANLIIRHYGEEICLLLSRA